LNLRLNPNFNSKLKGVRPNVRDAKGRTALQLIVESEAVWGNRFGSAVDMLLCYGARLLDESPQSIYIKESEQVQLEESIEEWTNLALVDADSISLTKTPMADYGLQLNSSASSDNLSPKKKEGKDKDKSGKDKVCCLCDFKFTMFRRQHHCRMCDTVCCEDCSRKKATVEEKQVRCCDSCFNYLSHEIMRQKKISKLKEAARSTRQVHTPSVSSTSSSQVKQDTNKKALFGNSKTQSSGSGKDRDSRRHSVSDGAGSGLSGTMSTMSEAHERMMERGEKLTRLTDKSADVSNAAEEFAKLAKQLNEKSSDRWF
jgi:hypothetical protein